VRLCGLEVGYDQNLWNVMAREMGWAGTRSPVAYGGAGLGMVELAILQHELRKPVGTITVSYFPRFALPRLS